MRATSPIAVVLVLLTLLSSSTALATRVLIAPVGGQGDPATLDTLGRGIEAAVADLLPKAELISSTTIQAAVELAMLRDCIGDDSGGCLSEIADAANADYIVRPQLGKLGNELVLSLSILDGGGNARLLGQQQIRAASDQPMRLLDQVPDLVADVAAAAGLVRGRPPSLRGPPVLPITLLAIGGAGVVGGAILLGLHLNTAGKYERAELNRNDAAAFEKDRDLAAGGSSTLLVAGGILAVIGVGLLVAPATVTE